MSSPPAAPCGLTAEEIAEGRRLIEAMSEGPWGITARGYREEHDVDGAAGADLSGFHRGMFERKADAEGVAWLRNHAPSLLSLAEEAGRLREALEATLARLDYLQDLWGKEGVTDGLVRQLRSALSPSSPAGDGGAEG